MFSNIDINSKTLKILKQYGINGKFKKSGIFENLIEHKIKFSEQQEYYTFKDLQVKVRVYKPITFLNKSFELIKIVILSFLLDLSE